MPERIQLSRKKGWRMPPNTVKVDRTTNWGNPYVVKPASDSTGPARTAEEAVALFRATVEQSGYVGLIAIATLRGQNLACWCAPGAPCHADVLLELANP